MRRLLLASGIGLVSVVAMAPAGAADGHTTVVQDENGTSVITQSGDPAQAEVKINKQPGRTTVYRRSGGNTAIVTQGTGNAQDVLDWLRRAGDAGRPTVREGTMGLAVSAPYQR